MQQSDAHPLASVLDRLLRIGFGLGGFSTIATGAWMLFSPRNWYEVFPGRVADFGTYNSHFVRDLGGWYLAGGILFLFALTNPMRFGGVALITSFVAMFSHAAAHVADIASGRVGGEHWIIDTPLVFLPVAGIGVMLWIWWSLQSERFSEFDPGDENQEA